VVWAFARPSTSVGTRSVPAAWHRRVDALVLSSPAQESAFGMIDRLLLAVMPSLAPNVAVANGLRPEWISRDEKTVASYVADPLGHDRITFGLGRLILDAGVFARTAAPC